MQPVSSCNNNMGCCLCRPDTDVLNDPLVTMHVTVGDIAIVSQYSRSVIKGYCSGLMYIKEDTLYYETVCGGRLCCQCCRREFNISHITGVEVIENQLVRLEVFGNQRPVWFPRERYNDNFIILRPGLKITVKSTSGSITTIVVAMPDAMEFANLLSKLVPLNQNMPEHAR